MPVTRRDELINAAGWAAAGAAILIASWRMDRLDNRGINPWSVPGLTPGLVGALMILLALMLALAPRAPAVDASAPADSGGLRRTAGVLVLCLGFGAVTLGSGLPFVLQAAVFIFAFTSLFSWSAWRAAGAVGRGLAQTALIAAIAAAAISWLFESVFLVRLP